MSGGTTIVDRLNKLSGKDATTISKAVENLEDVIGGGGSGGITIISLPVVFSDSNGSSMMFDVSITFDEIADICNRITSGDYIVFKVDFSAPGQPESAHSSVWFSEYSCSADSQMSMYTLLSTTSMVMVDTGETGVQNQLAMLEIRASRGDQITAQFSLKVLYL